MKRILVVVLASLIASSSPAQNTGGGGTVYLRQLERGTAGYVITGQGAGGAPIYTALAGAGLGDFSGPASSTANAIVRFSGVGGKTGKDSAVTVADTTGAIAWGAGTTASLTSLAGTPILLAGGTAGSDFVRVTNTTTAVSPITGAFRVGNLTAATTVSMGGGNIYAGGLISGGTTTTGALIDSPNAVVRVYGVSGAYQWYKDATPTKGARLLFNNSTNGLTVAMYDGATWNDTVNFAGTPAVSTSTTTGAVTVNGGVGITGSAYIGGNTFVLGNLTVSGVTTIATSTPVNAVATGNPGYIVWDANFIYVCIAANTWKRVAIATW